MKEVIDKEVDEGRVKEVISEWTKVDDERCYT